MFEEPLVKRAMALMEKVDEAWRGRVKERKATGKESSETTSLEVGEDLKGKVPEVPELQGTLW